MLQWRNWHTRQIQTLFSPGSTPGWSTIFEINSGGDFVNNISAVAIGKLIAAHREGDEEKFRAYVELIAETYEVSRGKSFWMKQQNRLHTMRQAGMSLMFWGPVAPILELPKQLPRKKHCNGC